VPDAVAGSLLDGVRERVAVVQCLASGVAVAAPALSQVTDDHVDLDLDGPLRELTEDR
jgi:hypothetical protein